MNVGCIDDALGDSWELSMFRLIASLETLLLYVVVHTAFTQLY